MELKSTELFKSIQNCLIKIGKYCSLNTRDTANLSRTVRDMPIFVVGEFSAGKKLSFKLLHGKESPLCRNNSGNRNARRVVLF